MGNRDQGPGTRRSAPLDLVAIRPEAETDQALSYDGFFEVIREHLRTRSTAAGTLNDLMPDLLTLFPMLADVDLGRTPPTLSRSTLTHLESGASESGTSVFETLANTLTRVAGGRALAIHLEDLHAANVSVEALHRWIAAQSALSQATN